MSKERKTWNTLYICVLVRKDEETLYVTAYKHSRVEPFVTYCSLLNRVLSLKGSLIVKFKEM